jgi:uncharacterized protein YidB (DUF937 family)
MSRGMPAMTALLGMLAIAGYQNRDKLAELLRGPGAGSLQPANAQQPLGGLLGNLTGMLSGAGVGAPRRNWRTPGEVQSKWPRRRG